MSTASNTPLVSVIVPMYGVENYIARCAESLFAQTYPNIEFIFVDDGGKDRTVEILRGILEKQEPALQARARIISKENGGLPHARKTGLDAATGEYVLHVDSDDWLETTAVEKLVRKAVETEADIVVYDFWKEYPNRSKLDSERDSSAADPDIAPDRRQDPSDRQGGVRPCGKQDLGEHGGGGRLAVCAADSDRKAVVAHELTQKLRPCQGRDLHFLHSFILRIVRMNGGGEDRQVDVFRDVFSPLSDHDPDPGVFQGTGDLGSGPVRS